MARKNLLEKAASFRVSEKDKDMVFRVIVLEQSWDTIKEAYGLARVYYLKQRFEQLTSNPKLIQDIVASESIRRQQPALAAGEKPSAVIDQPAELYELMPPPSGQPLDLPVDLVAEALPESMHSTTGSVGVVEDEEDTVVEDEEDTVVEDEEDTVVFIPDSPIRSETSFWNTTSAPSRNAPPSIPSTIFGKHSVTDYNRDLIVPMREVVTTYLNMFGPLSMNNREALYETLIMVRERKLPVEWIKEAILVVGKKVPDKRTMGYIIGLIRNWCTKGRGVLDNQVERSVLDFVKKQMGYMHNQEIEQEIIKNMGIYGPVETLIKLQETLSEFNISTNILTTLKKNMGRI